jgi:hypothetical protein
MNTRPVAVLGIAPFSKHTAEDDESILKLSTIGLFRSVRIRYITAFSVRLAF